MIKSLLGEDEIMKEEEAKVDKAKSSSVTSIFPDDEIESVDEIKAAILSDSAPKSDVEAFEIARPIGQPKIEDQTNTAAKNIENVVAENNPLSAKAAALDKEILAIEKELAEDADLTSGDSAEKVEVNPAAGGRFDLSPVKEGEAKIHISQKPFTPESAGETARKSGLAFSAGISLFASVVFMLILGWFVDLYVGSIPWGIVGGITLGAIIGFVQFFRTTRQIINPQSSDFEKTSLFSSENDKKF